MFKTGLVSVSFRSLSVDKIISLARENRLSAIEWGSDVHAPMDDTERLNYIKAKMDRAGLYTSSYGTYFRIGETPTEKLHEYISAAKILGTNVLRLWCGRKNYEDTTEKERESMVFEAISAARIAEKEGVTVGIECHNNTFTSCPEGALALMRGVNSSAFRMYWQPLGDVDADIEYAKSIAPYILNVHVFNRSSEGKRPLSEGLDIWQKYLSYFDRTQHLLLEFMPDGLSESLASEAESLRCLI